MRIKKSISKNIRKSIVLFTVLIMAVLPLLTGCSSRQDTQGSQVSSTSDAQNQHMTAENTEEKDTAGSSEKLQVDNAIPADGIITAEQFETIAGENIDVNFHGESDGMTYTWTFRGEQIKNAIDQNLLINLTDERVDEVKEMANHATAGIGLEFHNEGDQIALPQIVIKLEEKLDADTLVLCGIQDDKAAKICDVEIDNSGDASILTFTPGQTDGTCYIVGGKSSSGDHTAAAQTEAGPQIDNETQNTSGQTQETSAPETSAGSETSQDTATADICTIRITCASILNNMDKLTSGKEEFVPSNGVILDTSQVQFTPGENAYDILTRACQDAAIQMEANFTPAYNSAYIEGINQLYEFDCGELSGWMFSVNGWFPNYGCSLYEVQPQDALEFVYTCDLGRDIGGSGSSGSGNGPS